MTDLFDQLPAIAQSPQIPSAGAKLSKNGKRLGRPPGAHNRRSLDLARYVEATYGGMTPGQQSAEIALVKPKDLRDAKAAARELMIGGASGLDLPPLLLAYVVKAKRLGQALGCSTTEAWVLMAKERMELMAYIHQKQPAATPDQAKVLPTMFVVDQRDIEAAALGAPAGGGDVEILEDFELPRDEVS